MAERKGVWRRIKPRQLRAEHVVGRGVDGWRLESGAHETKSEELTDAKGS